VYIRNGFKAEWDFESQANITCIYLAVKIHNKLIGGRMNNKIIHIVLHHFVEFVCAIGIVVITGIYMSVGGFETPIILGAMGAIVTISALDVLKKDKES